MMENLNNPEAGNSSKAQLLSPNRQRFTLSRLEIIFGGLILLGLIYIGYIIFFQDGPGNSSGLEKRLKTLEALSRQQEEKINGEIKALQNAQAQWENRLKALETTAAKPRPAPAIPVASTPAVVSPLPVKKAQEIKGEKKPTPAAAERKRTQHKVKKGETLTSIAAKYRVSPNDLIRWNKNIKNKQVRAGEILVILAR
ncbi:MAG: LysM peptidoglycan-binding domain-containing protein [Thermodesulfobacteriota bacterium]